MLLLGDWVPEQNDPQIEIDTQNELVLLNLEGPVLSSSVGFDPIVKSGPHLFSATLPSFENSETVCLTLANNHINDYGWTAIQETLSQISKRKYYWVGVGENEENAQKPLLLTFQNRRYGILSFAETQIGRATSNQSGPANIGPWVYQAIRQLRTTVDIVILSVHAGNEILPWPSPFIQDLYRSYIDAGANVVHGHHPHVPQGTERYNSGVICYGLGNFLGSPARYSSFQTQLSLGVRLKHEDGLLDFHIETYRFHQVEGRIVVSKDQSEQSQAYVAAIQRPLSNRPLLEAIWQEAAMWLYDRYGRDSMGLPVTTEKRHFVRPQDYLKTIARRLKRHFSVRPSAVHQNQILWYSMFACLSHRQMMETALGVLSGELSDVRTPESRKLVSDFLSPVF